MNVGELQRNLASLPGEMPVAMQIRSTGIGPWERWVDEVVVGVYDDQETALLIPGEFLRIESPG